MPAIENPSLFARLRRTTMTELLRGRISSGHTPAMIIAASDLDASTKSLIADICKRTRLWNAERVDVARELVAHFADGKDAGESSETLIRAFGDPTQAAKLIRRAKIRNRSMLWHAKRFLLRAAGVLIVGYAGLAIYFSTGTPTISVDYVAKLNEPILKMPQDQRAWPFYRQLADAYAADPVLLDKSFDLWPSTRPAAWSRTSAWVRANPQLLALLDQATSRPNMGFINGPQGSASELKAAANAANPAAKPSDPFYNSVIGLLLPHLTQLRQSANLLACDAKMASEEGDAGRWMKRIEQLQTVADHSSESGFLVSGYVRVGIEWIRLNRIDAMFRENPGLLSDKQLAELAHRNARHQTPGDLITFKTERLGFQDIVQRIYTDDGHGDGRIAARGISNMQAVTSTGNNNNVFSASDTSVSEQVSKAALAPVAVLMLASRKDLLERYNSIMDRAEARLHQPWRTHARDPLFIEAQNIKSSMVDSWRYLLISVMVPSIDRAGITAERVLVRRDAIQIGIALELFKRKAGNYPATLAELSPTYLPTAPLDPCDGLPMRYKLVDGKPLVYSVGVDLDDDGGIVPVPKAEFVKSYSHRKGNGYELAIGQSSERYDGDWVLYPEPDFSSDDEDADEGATPATQPSLVP